MMVTFLFLSRSDIAVYSSELYNEHILRGAERFDRS